MDAVASLLAERVSFRVTSVDRIVVAGYIPGLQYEGGVVRFLLNRGYPIPSPAGLARNHDRLVAEIERLVASRGVEVVRFAKRQSKEEVSATRRPTAPSRSDRQADTIPPLYSHPLLHN